MTAAETEPKDFGLLYNKENRASLRTRTVPEQIADHVALAILKGDFRNGEHLPEQRIAAVFGVSHGPVREAIRTLAQCGLVEFRPRRGAFVIEVTLDAVADIFNIRAMLLGLAAHTLSQRPLSERPVAKLQEQVANVRALAASPTVSPMDYAQALTVLSRTIYRACGNAHLVRIVRKETTGSLWGHLWRQHTLDFLSEERRAASASDWTHLVDAIIAGDGVRAGAISRKALFDSRDTAIEALQALRGESIDRSRLIRE